MSRETLTWLNTNTLIGFTDKRGKAWHYRAEEQDGRSNHYPGAIPVGDVEKRLFSWLGESRRVAVEVPAELDTMTHLGEDGLPKRWVVNADRQAIARSDDSDGDVLGIFAPGYAIHQYREWLLNTVSTLLGDTLSIGSAGLLKRGGVAWVSVEVPETIRTPEGVTFRPNLLSVTSMDGSLATTYKRVVTNTVCDNTMAQGLGEDGQQIKVKHTRYSRVKLAEARDALMMLDMTADDFAAEVAQLSKVTVTDRQWFAFLDALAPVPQEPGRARTMAGNKQDALNRLWTKDERVEPWKNTAWGVMQAVNTFTHHEGIVRGADRAERNMLRAVTGGVDKLDSGTLTVLNQVLASA